MNTIPKILITAPSFDERENVSGVVSVVRLIMKLPGYSFTHFRLGRRDNERSGIFWLMSQIGSLFSFVRVVGRFDLVHISYSLNPPSILRDFFYGLLARLFGKKLIVHVHGGKYLTRKPDNFLLNAMIRQLLRYAHRVLVLSAREEQLLQENYGHYPVSILPNCVEFPADIQRSENSGPHLRLLFFGRIHESKGIWDICEAMKILVQQKENVILDVYGKGPEQERFIASCSLAMGEQFRYRGVASGSEKWKVLASYDVLLLPSRYGEGLPMAMLEAMAVGLVVVVTDDASITTVIEDGTNGILVQKNDPRALAEKISFLAGNRALVQAIGEKARQTIRSQFTVDNYLYRLDSIYKQLV